MSTQTVPVSSFSGIASLLSRFRDVRAATLAFTAPLSPEDMMVQSCAEASPVKWHLAHSSWFFETFVLTPFSGGYKVFHPDFAWLFNSYYTSLGDMPAKNLRSSFSRPPLDAIFAYRRYVDAALVALLESDLQEQEEDVLRRVVLGLEHEQQHLELIATDFKHALFTNPLQPAYLAAEGTNRQYAAQTSNDALASAYTSFEGGLTQIGVSPDPSDPVVFAFDNETPRHTVFLHPFRIANRLVTTREFFAFIDDNGYNRPELWLSEGWSTMRASAWQAPLYWRRDSDAPSGWSMFTLHGWRSLDELFDTPVCHLSFFEADAFARWSGCRLPTEFEWEHAAASLEENAEALGHFSANMLESGSLHPSPAAVSSSLQQMYGDVWEWTSSGYTGYPGYRPLPGALGEYNGKFMSSQVILRGGSCVTPASHIRSTYRNFFPGATRWQFSGLRLAQDNGPLG